MTAKRGYRFILILSIPLLSGCSYQRVDGDIIISNVSIINVQSGDILFGQDVIIKGDSIAEIRQTQSIVNEESLQIIDGTGKFLIPGLWDMHTHTLTDYRYRHNIPIQISYGITGFRDMGGSIALRDSIERLSLFMNLPIPRMKAAGYILGGDPGRNGARTATMEEGREYVKLLAAAGADFIKTYYYLHPEVYLAILDEAGKHGLTVQGHVPQAFGIQRAGELGQKSFEHMSAVPYWTTRESEDISRTIMSMWYDGQEGPSYSGELLDQVMDATDTSVINQLAQTLRLNNAYLCPTIVTYEYLTHIASEEYKANPFLDLMNPIEAYYFNDDLKWSEEIYMQDSLRGIRHLETRKHILRQLFDQGTPVIAGTDAGVAFHGLHLHKELQIYVESGVSPLQALQTATINPAKFMGLENKLGTIEAGKWADLVLLEENPLEDVQNTRTISGVMVRGRYASRQQIDQVLDSLRAVRARPLIIDTVKSLLPENGAREAIKIAKHLKDVNPHAYQFDGQQFVLFALELWEEDKVDEVKELLLAELQINPSEQWFALIRLGALYRQQNQSDSARLVYERLLKYFGETELRAKSHLRRLKDPEYGVPSVRAIPDSVRKYFSNIYSNDTGQDYRFDLVDDKLVIHSGEETDTMVYVGNHVFRSPDEYHDRLVIWENDVLLRMNYGYTAELNTVTE